MAQFLEDLPKNSQKTAMSNESKNSLGLMILIPRNCRSFCKMTVTAQNAVGISFDGTLQDPVVRRIFTNFVKGFLRDDVLGE